MNLKPRFQTWPRTVAVGIAYTAIVFGAFAYFEPLPVSAVVRHFSNLVVKPGEEVMVRYDAIRQRDGCVAKIDRWWIDVAGNIIARNETETRDLDSEDINYEGMVVVPMIANRGILRMRSKVEFFCNGVQQALGGSKVVLPDAYFLVR